MPTVAVKVPLARFVSVTAPDRSPARVIVGSAVLVVTILIPALPLKFAVPVTAPLT